jgi:hypothetical protein
MSRNCFIFSLLFFLFFPSIRLVAQELNPRIVEITSHVSGDVIQGVVSIAGNSDVEGFISWELTYSYAEDSTGTWFLIYESDIPVQDNTLAEMDTTRITDGNYNIRLTVYLKESRRAHFTIRDIRVRNYSPIETNTPAPPFTSTPSTVTPLLNQTDTGESQPSETPPPKTPTPLPTNPIRISPSDISNTLIRGIVGAVAAFLLIGLYITIQKAVSKS